MNERKSQISTKKKNPKKMCPFKKSPMTIGLIFFGDWTILTSSFQLFRSETSTSLGYIGKMKRKQQRYTVEILNKERKYYATLILRI